MNLARTTPTPGVAGMNLARITPAPGVTGREWMLGQYRFRSGIARLADSPPSGLERVSASFDLLSLERTSQFHRQVRQRVERQLGARRWRSPSSRATRKKEKKGWNDG